MCTHARVHRSLTRHPALRHGSHGPHERLGLMAGKGHLRGERGSWFSQSIQLPFQIGKVWKVAPSPQGVPIPIFPLLRSPKSDTVE